jgi:filamentous hemagglutinin
LQIFYLVLRDSGRDHSVPTAAGYRNYNAGYAAIAALFPEPAAAGNISLTSREIKTASGGNISLFAPAGGLTVGFNVAGSQAVDQGILTEDGGNISIFTRDSVVVGTSRIFTLRGGNEIIWSSAGNIAAGASSKTVQSAPPTRVLVDPQSGDVKTDLAGLATGGGIGVLETVKGVPPGDVDLIAPVGSIDAGDAGIRVSGNLNISAVTVLNSSNVQVGGTSVGTPAAVTTSLAGAITAASSSAAAGASAADQVARQAQPPEAPPETPSIITVEVLGYGG